MVMYSAEEPRTNILALLTKHEPEGEAIAKELRLRAKLLGLVLSRQMHNVGVSPKQFASVLSLDEDMAQAILEGWFPATEIADDLVQDMAHVVRLPPNILYIVLGREISPCENDALPKTGANP